MRVLVCGAQVPFVHGGAEILSASLVEQLRARGFEADCVTLPYNWKNHLDLLKNALMWRLVDLDKIDGLRVDLVIGTRFPSYLIRHPNKVVWLVHQFRQAYDLLGTVHSDFTQAPADRRVLDLVRAMDRRAFAEARAVFTISQNTANRLRLHNEVAARVLYPPPKLQERYRGGEFGDYIFSAGRLNPMKRFDLLIRALAHTAAPLRCKIAGAGTERGPLLELAQRLGLADRVELLDWVSDEDLVGLYAESLAVYYAPIDEDYGYVTVEAFLAGKPVVTTRDAGGVLEFVEDAVNGFVCAPDAPRELAARFDLLQGDRELARRLGAAGRTRVEGIGWDTVIAALTDPASLERA